MATRTFTILYAVLALTIACDTLEQAPATFGPDLATPVDASIIDTGIDANVQCPPGQSQVGEFCNGKDDDCDGRVDEGFSNCMDPIRCLDGQVRPCSNECGMGQQTCRTGVWSACAVESANIEYCNNADDDCDGAVDEDGACEMDSEALDLGVPDATLDASAPEDMMIEPDMFRPPPPECIESLDCDAPQYCLRQNCISSLPGTYVFTLLSVRIDPDETGDAFGGWPDVYAVLSVGNEEVGRTDEVEAEEFVQWNERMETQLLSGDRLSICMYDADVFGDEEIGCLEFTSDDIVDQIRRYDGNRPANQLLWALLNPMPPRNVLFTEIRFSVERLIRQ